MHLLRAKEEKGGRPDDKVFQPLYNGRVREFVLFSRLKVRFKFLQFSANEALVFGP
jgi:hypothetical protein